MRTFEQATLSGSTHNLHEYEYPQHHDGYPLPAADSIPRVAASHRRKSQDARGLKAGKMRQGLIMRPSVVAVFQHRGCKKSSSTDECVRVGCVSVPPRRGMPRPRYFQRAKENMSLLPSVQRVLDYAPHRCSLALCLPLERFAFRGFM